MKFVFRCDASIDIGTGHVMRCLTLAEALNAKGHQCAFICKKHEGNVIEKIKEKGYKVHSLVSDKNYEANSLAHSKWLGSSQLNDAKQCQIWLDSIGILCDWLIIDHYGIDIEWESLLRPYTRKIMVIDDLADRRHNCDILLDQNIGRTKSDYEGITNKDSLLLVGNKYCLLRSQFDEVRNEQNRNIKSSQLKSLLVYFGGTDPKGMTLRIIDTLSSHIYDNFKVIVIIGSGNKDSGKIRNKCVLKNIELLTEVHNMAIIIDKVDTAIVSCGFICYELAYMSIPALYFGLSDIQKKVAFHLEQQGLGIALSLDSYEGYDYGLLIDQVMNIDEKSFVGFKENGTHRVIHELLGIINEHQETLSRPIY